MATRVARFVGLLSLALLLGGGCTKKAPEQVIKHYPVDSMDGIVAEGGVAIDNDVSSDGRGALRIDATEPGTVRLYVNEDIDLDNARLIYRAHLRSENLDGQAYLEMWCHFDEKGQYFSRALQAPLSGTTDWTAQETPFFLQKGENPDRVRLNLVVHGTGTVWIDDIDLLEAPLQ
jgi:hypothetical protein